MEGLSGPRAQVLPLFPQAQPCLDLGLQSCSPLLPHAQGACSMHSGDEGAFRSLSHLGLSPCLPEV